jgi:diguanylate cyclase (GGDEF)-like protein/PAS domain S-box-containing protein
LQHNIYRQKTLNPPRHRRWSLTRHKRSLWALPAFGLLLVAAIWTATWLQLRATERELISAETHDTESLTAEFEEYTRRAIDDADRTALLVKHEYEQRGMVDLPELIRVGLLKSSGPVVVSIADAKGNIIARSQPAKSFNMSDRDFFRRHADQDTGLLDISKPVVSRVSGRSMILLSRRLNHPDGSFSGIVLLSVAPEYFTEFYQEGELGKWGNLALLGLDGTFRASRVGENAASLPDGIGVLLAARAATNPAGNYQARSDIDHVMRIVAYRKVPDYPFIVTIARAIDEALADFYRNRSYYLIIAVATTAVILVFFSIVTVLAVRLQRNRGELKVQRQFLATLVDNVPSGLAVRSMRPGEFGQYVLWSESNALIYGRKAEDALGKTVLDVMPDHHAAPVMDLDQQLLASPMVQEVELMREVPGKGQRVYHLIRAPIFGTQGQVDYIMTSSTDITEARARTDELQLASRVFETTADAIVLSDADDCVVMVNAAFSRLTGYDAQDIVGKVLAESPFAPIDLAASDARMEVLQRDGVVTGEVERFRKDGTALSLWVTASCVRNADGTIRNYVRVFTDISLLKATQQKLEQLASFDPLTGLPNRRLLLDRLEQAALRAQRGNKGMAVMFIDLDGFKNVNDTLGHNVGDLLLREVALRLQNCIRSSDSIGRLGGDEFAIVLEDAQGPTDAAHIGERIVAALALPFVLDRHRVMTAASIGIAVYPNDGTDASTLLKNADVAMYQAKQAGRNRFKFFSQRKEAVATVG